MAKFNFLLNSRTFEQNELTQVEICKNIEQLVLLKNKLSDFNENLFKEEDIYTVSIIDNKKIYEVIYDNTLDTDCKYMLSSIIDRTKDVIEDIDIDRCVGLNYIPNKNCMYCVNDWIEFHHFILSTVFTNEKDFYFDMVKYFPTLKFHDNIINTLTTLDGECEYFIKDIVNSLKCLDENLHEDIVNTNNNLTEALKRITAKIGLSVTLEGNTSRKKELSFIFKTDKDEEQSVYCESHVKLENSSKKSDNSWYSNRIYFHQGCDNIKDGQILVGYIGKHL